MPIIFPYRKKFPFPCPGIFKNGASDFKNILYACLVTLCETEAKNSLNESLSPQFVL